MDRSDLQLQTDIETRLGKIAQLPANQVHEVLGVSRTSWLEYRSAIRPMPKYVRRSIEAHLCLDDIELADLLETRKVEPKSASRRGRPVKEQPQDPEADIDDLLG